MKIFIFFLFNLIGFSALSYAQEHEPIFASILEKNVLLYESPISTSPIVRRVFPGEVLKIVETVKNEQDEVWGKVFLSPSQFAFIQSAYFASGGTLQQALWKPQEVLRTKMPFSFAMKGPSEFFGAGLQFRYLPFARLGLEIGVGSVLDGGQMKGSAMSYGVVFMLSMGNFSPFIETGTSSLIFNDSHSTLRISTFYVNAGIEWIRPSGYFFGLGLNYSRSYDVQVGFDYAYAKSSSGSLAVGNYGSFNKLDGAASLVQLSPLFIIGYSF